MKKSDYRLRVIAPGLAEPHVRVGGGPGSGEFFHLPEHVTAFAETDAFIVEIRTALDADLSPTIDEIRIRARDGAKIPTAVLRELGMADLLKRVVDLSTYRWVLDDERKGTWTLDPEGPQPGDGARFLRPKHRPRRSPQERDAVLRQAADAYNDAVRQGLRAPIRHVAEALGQVSEKTAQRRVNEAREAGLLDEEPKR